MTMPWFRLYSEVLNDPKLHRASKMTKQSYATILGTWTVLLALASHSPKRGQLRFSDDLWWHYDEIKEKTGLDQETFDSIMETFADLKLIGTATGDDWVICNWDKRQFKSDHSTPRVQKHRAQADETAIGNDDEMLPCNVTPSLQKHDSNALDTDTESDPDTEKDSASKNRSPPPQSPSKPAKKPKKPIPPAVSAFRDAAHRFPAKSWWGKVVAAVGEAEADLAFWGRVVENYVGCGWNAGNVKTMLEFYRRREIPTVGKQRKKQPGQFTDTELEEARRASLAEEPIDVAAFLGEGT